MIVERAANDNICCDIPSGHELTCCRCDVRYHATCEGIGEDDSETIESFFCRTCERCDQVLTIWKQRMPDRDKRREKREHYYTGDRILAHKKEGTVRYFLIKWKDFGVQENSWESEHHLDGYLNILNRYCRADKIQLTKIIGYYGSPDNINSNEENWVTIQQVIDCYEKYQKHIGGHRKLPICEFRQKMPKTDAIVIYPRDFHLFVLLYVKLSKSCIIADGLNLCVTENNIFAEIAGDLQLELQVCQFNQQFRNDFCGSSAVLIALEFKRMYMHGLIRESVSASTRLVKRITSSLHKGHSNRREEQGDEYKRSVICRHCQKRFRFYKRTAFSNHENKCPKRTVWISSRSHHFCLQANIKHIIIKKQLRNY